MDESKLPPRKQPPEVPRLSGPEVRSRTFRKALFGYGVEEVDAFLEHVARVIDRAARHERDLTERLQALEEEVRRFRAREAELTRLREEAEAESARVRQDAEEHAQRILREAEKGAQLVRGKAEEWLASLFERVEETERRRTSFFTAFRSALDSHYELLRKDEAATVPLKTELMQFLRKSFEVPAENRTPRLNS
jgi:cell division initiation protein